MIRIWNRCNMEIILANECQDKKKYINISSMNLKYVNLDKKNSSNNIKIEKRQTNVCCNINEQNQICFIF